MRSAVTDFSNRLNRYYPVLHCLIIVSSLVLSATTPSFGDNRYSKSQPTISKTTGSAQDSTNALPNWLGEIKTRAEFDLLSRVYHRGRLQALPHAMFVIDRSSHNRVYFVNSRLYQFHKDFVNAMYLSLERGRAFLDNNHLRGDRRFLLGTIAYQATFDKFTFEFWEGDQLSGPLLAETIKALRSTFFAPLHFKPNSLAQEQAANELKKTTPNVLILTPGEIATNQQYQPLNLGVGIGQLRIIDRITEDTVIDRNQIVILKEVPIHLTPLSGLITTEPASPLSHVNLLARSWAIPNATIRNADALFKVLEGKYVRLEVGENGYTLEPANSREVAERNKQWVKRGDLITPGADVIFRRLTDLRLQRARDAVRFGAKSANLGEIINSRVPGLDVPAGYTIPFRYYVDFIRRNNLEERIAAAVEEERFVHDARYRKTKLSEIRRWIQEGNHDETFRRAVLEKTHRQYPGFGLFVRSSTNAEDLANFSGAGLYTTVPNVRNDDQLMDAIKTVWASIWNYEAYEARENFGMNHFGVYPAVLIQQGINADSAGVAITKDPYNPADRGAVFVNAKRGLGIKVVEGRRVAEQVLYHPESREIRVLTRSDEDSMLVFDERGGVKEVAVEKERRVLTDAFVRELALAALRIKRIFGARDQDIEWVYSRGRLYIVQSRPYIEGS
ncbi:MAG TPA: PEP/pyruvate-binding domain-containing protein [Blastocatellia bacterium]|nr:PEP/pyruvate-binding domain-containing protein [Blastocatellia bacterium]